MTARTDAAGCFRGLKQVSQGNPQGLLKVVEAYVRRKKRALLMALNVVCCETETSIRVEGLAKVGVHRDQSAAAVLGRVIAQLDHRTNVACRIDHHVPGQIGDLTGTQARLDGQQDDHTVTEGMSGAACKNQEVADVANREYFCLFASHSKSKV